MKKYLILCLSLALGFVSISPVWTGVSSSAHPIENAPPIITNEEMALLFESSATPLEVAALSPLEMKETEGAWGFSFSNPWSAAVFLASAVWMKTTKSEKDKATAGKLMSLTSLDLKGAF